MAYLPHGPQGRCAADVRRAPQLYPASSEVPPALYWRGRLAENDKDIPLARACYTRLSDFFRYFYYGNLARSEEHTSELQSPDHLVCRLLLEKKKKKYTD